MIRFLSLGLVGALIRSPEVGIKSHVVVIRGVLRWVEVLWPRMGPAAVYRPVWLVPHVIVGHPMILVGLASSEVGSVLLQGHCRYTDLIALIALLQGEI